MWKDPLVLRFVPEHSFPLQNAAPRSEISPLSEIGSPKLGPSLAVSGWVDGSYENKAFSCQISLLHEGEHVWSWCQAGESTNQAAEPREPEAAQTLLGPVGSIGLGEKCAIAAFLWKDPLVLRLVP